MIIHLAAGYRGVRQLAAARAEIELRKRGYAPKIKYNNNGSGRAWTDENYDEAAAMQRRGMTHRQIAQAIGRTKVAVATALGREARPQRCAVTA